MAATKKATKKTATVARKPRAKATPNKTFYAVVERGPFSARVVSLYATREAASNSANYLENQSSAIYNKFSVQRVDLAD